MRPHQTGIYRHWYQLPRLDLDHGEQSPTPAAAAAGKGPFCSVNAVLLVAMSERAAERMMPLRRRRDTHATIPLSPAPLTGLAAPQARSHSCHDLHKMCAIGQAHPGQMRPASRPRETSSGIWTARIGGSSCFSKAHPTCWELGRGIEPPLGLTSSQSILE